MIQFRLAVLLFFLTNSILFSQQNLQTSSLSFTENKGQIIDQNYQPNPGVLYLLNMPGLNVQLKNNGFSYDNYKTEILKDENHQTKIPSKYSEEIRNIRYDFHRIDFEFLNANPNFEKIEMEDVDGVKNYYLEHIPNGVFNVKSYKKIVYKNFYHNIDIEFLTTHDSLKPFEYNFVLRPGAKLEDIKFKINGAENVLNDGAIDVNVKFGILKETIPASWFENDKNEGVELSFQSFGDNLYGLQTNSDLTEKLKKSTLIVDPVPVRLWGTYFDSGVNDSNEDVFEINSNGDFIYFVGAATKNGLGTSGVFQSSFQGEVDGYLAKFHEDGQRIWTTYCGSNLTDHLEDLDFDSKGDIYVVGATGNSTGLFYTPGTHQSENYGSYEGIILKFNQNGTLNWGTYYGGESLDWLQTITVDRQNNFLYIAGSTFSREHITTPGAFQETAGNSSSPYRGFMAKFNMQGNRIWGSYYTGNIHDEIWDSTIDSDFNLIIVGDMGIPTGLDPFIAKISPNCEEIWRTFLGGYGHDQVYSVDINETDEIVVCGFTNSDENIATAGTFIDSPPGEYLNYVGYVMKFNSQGNKLWGTYIGDRNYNWSYDVEFSDSGFIYVAGETKSLINIASDDGYDPLLNNGEFDWQDGFLIKLSPTGQRIWGTYYGGNKYDFTHTVHVKNSNDIYIGGVTQSFVGIATEGAFQSTLAPSTGSSGYIVRFNDCQILSEIIFNCNSTSITLSTNDGSSGNWYGPNGLIGFGESIILENPDNEDIGEYTVEISTPNCSGIINYFLSSLGGEAPIPDIPNLPIINAVCSVTLTPPSAVDDCLGVLTATTDDPLFYDIPGEYWINWKFEDNYGNETYQDQLLILESGDNFMNESINFSICETETNYNLTLIEPDLTESAIEGISFNYFESMEDMVNNNPIPDPENYSNPNNLTEIYVKGTVENCSDFTIINIVLVPQPIANNITPTICDNDDDGVGQLTLNQYSNQICSEPDVTFQFFEDANHTLAIDPNIELNVTEGQVIYVIIANGNCEKESTITLTLGDYTLSAFSDFEVCDDNADTPFSFDLYTKSQEISTFFNVIPNEISYYFSLNDARNGNSPLNQNYPNQSNPQTIYASYLNLSGCPEIVSFDLVVNPNPIWDKQENYQKCEDAPIELIAPEGYTYLWSNGETTSQITVTEEGTYFVQISNEHCSIEKSILVEDFLPIAIDYQYDNEVFQIFPDTNLILEFSLDGVFWQQSPYFYNLNVNQEYEIWIRTESGCLQKETVFVYDKLPNLISPNGDGKNDYWDVRFLRNVLDIRVFDRYGKLIYEVNGENILPWDGKYLGRELPSGNYWYFVRFSSGKEIKGSIYLKNY